MENKFYQKDNNGNLIIGGVLAQDIVAKFKTPLYVMDKNLIESNILSYVNALTNYKAGGIISYASKAFSCKEIYRIAKSLDIAVDVVSMGEIYTALSVGFNAQKMFFHGNNKTIEELNFAIENKVGTIVIDSLSEINDVNDIALKSGVVQNVMIRVNPGVEAHTHHFIQTAKIDSKFGFSLENSDALNAILQIKKSSNLNLIGCHCHIGSQIFEKKSFILAAEKMLNFYNSLKTEYNIQFTTLNLGGGFGIWYAEGDGEMSASVYSDFIREICLFIEQKSLELGINAPYLVFEPGRSIVGLAGTTLYTVGRIKEIKGIKNYASIDGGMFDNPRFALYQAKYTVLAANKLNEKPTKKYTIAGKCCESGDIIAENVLLPELKEGDILAVLSTGAYNYSMSSNYNRNRIPPVVMVKNGVCEYAVKPQTLEDLIRNDV